MNWDARTVAVVAGLLGGLGWMGKIVIMTAQGGPDLTSLPESIAFFTGLAGVLTAAAAAGVHMTRSKGGAVRALAAVAAVVATALVVGIGQAVLSAITGQGWVGEEAIFGLVGLAFAVGAVVAMRRPREQVSVGH
jgi:hypothetical protein